METRSNQVLVGSITLGLLAALVVFVVWLSQVGGGGDKRYDIFFQQSVEGLAKGSSVTFSGVPVGQIESINLVPDSPQFIRVRITREQRHAGARGLDRDDPRRRLHRRLADPDRSAAGAGPGPAAAAAPRDPLPRAECAVRMSLWRAGAARSGRAR